MQDTRKLGAALFALVLLAWLPALWGRFVWDDINNLVNNDRLTQWSALVDSFRYNAMWSADRPQPAIGTYRPLSLASFVIDFQIWGRTAAGFHFTNLLLHATGALMVFLLFTRWVAQPLAAFALAGIWAMHPIGAEAVAWINGRSEVLALLFGAAALRVVSVPAIRPLRALAAGFLLFLAMLGKETGLAFVPLAILFAGEATAGDRPLWRRLNVPVTLAAVAAVAGYGYLRDSALEGGAAAGLGEGTSAIVALPAVWVRALRTVLLPDQISVHNLHLWLRDLPDVERYAYAGAAACIVLIAVALWWRGRRAAVIGLLWWLGSLTPIALIAIRNWPGLNRWLYIGLPGLLLALWLGGLDRLSRRAHHVILVLVLVPLGVQMQRAIQVWRHDGELFGRMIEEQPEEPFGYTGLGAFLLREQKYEEATKVLEHALAIGTNRPDHYLFLGMARAELGQCEEGARLARDHVTAGEVPVWFLQSAAGCFAKAGEVEKARRLYETCAERNAYCKSQLDKLPASAPPSTDAVPSDAAPDSGGTPPGLVPSDAAPESGGTPPSDAAPESRGTPPGSQ